MNKNLGGNLILLENQRVAEGGRGWQRVKGKKEIVSKENHSIT
mgnify:CR=1 FL=1